MAVEVRTASEADLDALIQLNQVVQGLHAELYPDDFSRVTDASAVGAFFAARLVEPASAIGIAEADRAATGYVLFEIQARAETAFTLPRSRIYVHHIAVATDARRRGVATALMRHVEQRAALEGIDDIVLDTWAANVDAQRFFSTRGFATFKVLLRKKVARR
jgi:ribosomal protein S18 acetylase RimI-like enzyme